MTTKNLSDLMRGYGLYIIAGLLVFVATATTHADTLYRQLEVGSRGSDVASLQTFLASDITLYPQGLVTSYFGFLTKAAVSNFQSRNGLPAVGRVGPMTLPVLNLQMAGGVSNSASAPIISSVRVATNRNDATVIWVTNELAQGLVYYSTNPLSTYENVNSVTVSGNTAMADNNLRSSQSVVLQNLQSNTTYYYLVYTTDQMGNVSVTWPTSFRTAQ
jgi:peptidoglycan hydrolase-like protein with peptidoglycan-binding domain